MRIWTDLISTPQEKCGQKLSTEQWEYLSEGNVMRLTYVKHIYCKFILVLFRFLTDILAKSCNFSGL